jgi:hypothetical protein
MATWREDIKNYILEAVGYHLNEESPQADQPATVKVALRPHQLTLLAAARGVERKASLTQLDITVPQLLTRYGVIADRVGAGKSLVALALMKEPPVEQTQFTLKEGGTARIIGIKHMPAVQEFKPEWSDISGSTLFSAMGLNLYSNSQMNKFYSRTNLLIVPHNVAQQWESYIKDQTSLKAYVVKKTKDCDYDRAGFYTDIFTSDLVVVSCTMIRKFIGAISFHGISFPNIVWSRVFVDEADSITCSLRPGEINTRFMWFITGSWLNMLFPNGMYTYTIQGLSEDVRKMIGDGVINGINSRYNIVGQSLSDSRDGRFASLVLRNSDEWIDSSLLRPVIVHDTLVCKAPANLGILRDFISPAAMEALHAGDTVGALAVLGLKAASQETLADRVTESLRGDLIQAEKILAFKRDIEYSTAAIKAHAIEKAEAKVIRLKEQLDALTARMASITTELCPICYDTPRTTTLTPCCRQGFCLACLCECITKKPSCPLCRQPIQSAKDLLVIGDVQAEEGVGSIEATGPPTKGAALLKLLSESTKDQRFLVFSAHEASFKGLRELLAARDIRCEVLQGTAQRVERLRKQFRDGTVRVLCMNARHVGAGINLEAATHVVLYHRMNVELERQVIGRAVRFERAAELRVVHLVHEEETAYNGASGSEIIMHV